MSPSERGGGPTGREHREFYLHPKYYDIAFDVRDTARECAFMAGLVKQHAKRPLKSAIELAAGPGYHALHYAKQGVRSLALDIEKAMVEYLRAKGGGAGASTLPLEVLEGDMRTFTLREPVDLAYVLFGSFCYLLTLDDVRANLRATLAALAPGGIYLLELPHPRRWLRAEVITRDEWTMTRDGTTVTTRWDMDHAVPDPQTQIMDVRSEYLVEEGGRKTRVRSRGRQRVFFAQEIQALAEQCGFRVAEWYGAMDRKVAFNYSKGAWRMVAVLQRA